MRSRPAVASRWSGVYVHSGCAGPQLRRAGRLDPVWQARSLAEVVRMRVLVAMTAALLVGSGPAVAGRSPTPAGMWTWPLGGTVGVVEQFDPPAQPWLAGQRGVVLAGRVGQPVLAAGDGVVGFVGRVGGLAVVTVLHGPLRTTYEPVRSVVTAGEAVRAGQPIGHLVRHGSQCAPAACLHWGLLRDETYLDPLSLLGLQRVRLLPLAR